MRGARGAGFVGAFLALGCTGPSLDVPQAGSGWSVELDPPSAPGSVSPSFRARIVGAPETGAPWLVRGALSDYHARALRRGEALPAVRERAVPLRYWRSSADCLLQPLSWLEPGESYTLALEGTGVVSTFQARDSAEPRATSLFPAPGRPKRNLLVLCDLPRPLTPPLTLEPSGVTLGAVAELEGVPRPGCVTLMPNDELADVAVAPPLVGGALLDPAPWLPRPSDDGPPPQARACRGRQLGGACLELQDDRLLITPEGDDQLWIVQSPAELVIEAASGQRRSLLAGLEPDTRVELRAAVLSGSGQIEEVATTLTTLPRRRHLVLTEVLSNPLGSENTAEWIEVLNDSGAPASLTGLNLVDTGGRVALPAVELEPGERALLVGSSFQPSSLDVSIPDSVRLVRLPTLGTRGLSNGGEALLVFGPEGVVSRFPQLAAKRAGHSVARRYIDAADDDPAAFAEHGDAGASPGAENTFDD